MPRVQATLLLVLACAAPVGAACTTARCPDPVAIEAVRTRVALACDCAVSTKHQDYVRCARSVIGAAVRDGDLPRPCKAPTAHCEASTTCGRPQAVVCCSRSRRGSVTARVVRRENRCRPAARSAACGATVATADACATDGGCVPPNLVVILVDDMGWADVGSFGAVDIATPNIDRLATEGMRLTDFYAAASCTPARAALLTGSHGQRVGVPSAYLSQSRNGLNPDEITIAEVLSARGYATALFGKWHLGDAPAFLPTRQGFDEFFGIPYSNDISPLHPLGPDLFPDLPLLEGETVLEFNPDQAKFTRRFTERAVDFIARHADAPFFLYLAHPMPHIPIFASGSFLGRSPRGLYGDVVEELDASVGTVLAALDAHGMTRRTLVVFASDNGPWLIMGNHGGSSAPLREGKNTVFEGGVRVPAIVRWPGQVPAGTTSAEIMGLIDVLPTIAGLAGAELPADRVLDGRDVWPILAGSPGAIGPHEEFFFHHAGGLRAVRSGRWKLHVPHPYDVVVTPGHDGTFGVGGQATVGLALFDLVADPGETTDVASAHPDEVARLLELAERGRADLGDALTGRTGSGVREAGRIP